MNACKNVCESDHRSKCKTAIMGGYAVRRYADGWKRCITCARAFLTPAARCPCCSYPLRSGRRTDWCKHRKQ